MPKPIRPRELAVSGAEPNPTVPPQPSMPPKVRVSAGTDKNLRVELVNGGSPRATFGTSDPDAINCLLAQMISAVCPMSNGKPPDENAINALLALLHGIGPGDALEGILAGQLVVCQHAAMDTMRRAMHPDQTPEGRRLYLTIGTRLMTTFATQVEVLNRGRGRGPVQRVIVERVNVEPGGQAVVGVVRSPRGGG